MARFVHEGLKVQAGFDVHEKIKNKRSKWSVAGYSLTLLLLAGCGSGGDDKKTVDPFTILQPLSPYYSGSAYANVMEGCVKARTEEALCSLQTLPFIIDDVATDEVPSVDAIMSRVVTSHPWMGIRFRQALVEMPSTIRRLMLPLTAIVISSDIRPSFYSGGTGAIYIDPAELWLDLEEKRSIDPDPDFRSGYGDGLSVMPLSRFVRGSDWAWDYYPLSGSETRSITDIVMPLAALLFHELAHANDYFPPDLIDSVNRRQAPWQVAEDTFENSVSGQLFEVMPLTSQLLMDLASVRYHGETATNEMRLLNAQEVGAEFEPDGAAIDYAYASIREDVATLFEEVMMKHYFNVDREVAFADMLTDEPSNYCDDYILGWGYRYRIGDPLVKSRAEFVVQRQLGQSDVSDYFDTIPEPQSLALGEDWCTVSSPEGVSMASVRPQALEKRLIPPTDFGMSYH